MKTCLSVALLLTYLSISVFGQPYNPAFVPGKVSETRPGSGGGTNIYNVSGSAIPGLSLVLGNGLSATSDSTTYTLSSFGITNNQDGVTLTNFVFYGSTNYFIGLYPEDDGLGGTIYTNITLRNGYWTSTSATPGSFIIHAFRSPDGRPMIYESSDKGILYFGGGETNSISTNWHSEAVHDGYCAIAWQIYPPARSYGLGSPRFVWNFGDVYAAADLTNNFQWALKDGDSDYPNNPHVFEFGNRNTNYIAIEAFKGGNVAFGWTNLTIIRGSSVAISNAYLGTNIAYFANDRSYFGTNGAYMRHDGVWSARQIISSDLSGSTNTALYELAVGAGKNVLFKRNQDTADENEESYYLSLYINGGLVPAFASQPLIDFVSSEFYDPDIAAYTNIQVRLNRGYWAGNGLGITNLQATNMVGGFTGVKTGGGLTFYVTNGVIINITP